MGNGVGTTVNTAVTKVTKVRRRLKNVFDVFEGVTPQVLIVGLDGAGKTTLLYNSKLDETIYANVPPAGLNIEQVTPIRGATVQLYDLSGSKMVRHHWCYWYRKAEAVIFVVDAADQERIDEALYELSELLDNRALRGTPIVFVANKQDIDGALSKEELTEKLALHNISDHDWSVFETSAEKSTGLKRVYKDVVTKIKTRRAEKKARRRSEKAASLAEKQTSSEIEVKETPESGKENEPNLFASVLRESSSKDKKHAPEDKTVDSNKSSEHGSFSESVVYDEMGGVTAEKAPEPNQDEHSDAISTGDSSSELDEYVKDKSVNAMDEDVNKVPEHPDTEINSVSGEEVEARLNEDIADSSAEFNQIKYERQKHDVRADSPELHTADKLFKHKYAIESDDTDDVSENFDEDINKLQPKINESKEIRHHQQLTVDSVLKKMHKADHEDDDEEEYTGSNEFNDIETVKVLEVGEEESDISEDDREPREENPDAAYVPESPGDESDMSTDSTEDIRAFIPRELNVTNDTRPAESDMVMQDFDVGVQMSEC